MSILRSSLSLTLRHIFELFEPDGQPVPIRSVLEPSRPVDQRSDDPLEAEFEKWSIVDFEQPVRDMDLKSGSIPIRWASKAAWWIFDSGRPLETIGCPNCSSASMTM
jgi:hypothetical protein